MVDVITVDCAVLGDQRVGKSALITAFCNPKETEHMTSYHMTTDPVIRNKQVRVPDSHTYEMFFFDVPGLPLYRDLVKRYIAECQSALLVFDVTRPDGLDTIEAWSETLTEATLQQSLPIVLVANHSFEADDDPDTIHRAARASEIADRNGWKLARCNAATRRDVDVPFMLLADSLNMSLDG